MATTTKTLTPTNQTITLPDMTERPDASVLVTDIGRNTDAINAVHGKLGDFTMKRLTTSGSSNNTLKIKLPESATEYMFFVFGSGSGGTSINYTLYARRSTSTATICNLGTASNVASISGEYVLIKGTVWQAVCLIADHDVTTEWTNT
jgi:hypothetical protein